MYCQNNCPDVSYKLVNLSMVRFLHEAIRVEFLIVARHFKHLGYHRESQ